MMMPDVTQSPDVFVLDPDLQKVGLSTPPRQTRTAKHELAHATRVARLGQGVYGTVHAPVLPRHQVILHSLPSYTESHLCVDTLHKYKSLEFLPARCFYTGVALSLDTGNGHSRSPSHAPWMLTRDHLVPLRRSVPDMGGLSALKHNQQRHNGQVLASHMVNVTLGLAPLLVRLKIRQWLRTVPFDPLDLSVEAGDNMRWIIIEMLNDFRLDGRWPWSRNGDGKWWNPELSTPFMARMHAAESAFLAMDPVAQQRYIDHHVWRF